MATGNLIKNFFDEATCSLCLEYFKDPVIIDCGHNFCRACLNRCWDKEDQRPSCPRCKKVIQPKNFRPNQQLANLVELIKKLPQERSEEDKWERCEKHQQPLKFFCKDDRIPTCTNCNRLKEHQAHNILPMEEAFQQYKSELQNQIQSLEKKREELMAQKLDEKQKSKKSLALLEKERQRSMSAFEHMQKAVTENKWTWLSLLDYLEKNIRKRQKENVMGLLHEISLLDDLIAEKSSKSQQSANAFLQDVSKSLSSSRYDRVLQRKLVLEKCPELEDTLEMCTQRSDALEVVVKDHKASLERALQRVNVTLDVQTAHPNLLISDDLRSVRRGSFNNRLDDQPERFDTMECVLGRERFTAGKHYWEVELEGISSGWVVGVALESIKRKGLVSFNPKEGIWAIQSEEYAYSSFSTKPCLTALTFPAQTVSCPLGNIRKIRVSLDYEECSVAFSDAGTGKSIFIFTSTAFSGERVCPFFWVSSGITLKCAAPN